MRVLMISDVFFPRIKGVSTSIATFADEFKRQRHSVDLIAPTYSNAGLEGSLQEDWIYRIPSRIVPFDPEGRLMSMKKVKALLPVLKQKNMMYCIFIHHS